MGDLTQLEGAQAFRQSFSNSSHHTRPAKETSKGSESDQKPWTDHTCGTADVSRMLRLVSDPALDVVPCGRRRCLSAGTGGGRGQSLQSLKLRMIHLAHARPRQAPRRCGQRCLRLLQEEVRDVGGEEAAAAVLCFHLLRLHAGARRGRWASKLFQVLWQATLLLPWPWLLNSSWPVFGLLNLVHHEMPFGNRSCAAEASVMHKALQQNVVELNEGEGLFVGASYDCGWVEVYTRRLLVALALYSQNSMAYRFWSVKTRSFELLPQAEGFEMALDSVQRSLNLIFDMLSGALRLVEMRGSAWDPFDVLCAIENLVLMRVGQHFEGLRSRFQVAIASWRSSCQADPPF